MGVLAKHEYLMLTSDAHGVGHCRCRLSVGGNREDLTLSAGIYGSVSVVVQWGALRLLGGCGLRRS